MPPWTPDSSDATRWCCQTYEVSYSFSLYMGRTYILLIETVIKCLIWLQIDHYSMKNYVKIKKIKKYWNQCSVQDFFVPSCSVEAKTHSVLVSRSDRDTYIISWMTVLSNLIRFSVNDKLNLIIFFLISEKKRLRISKFSIRRRTFNDIA